MNFIFEDLNELMNITGCDERNTSNIRKFPPSPLATVLSRIKTQRLYADQLDADTVTFDQWKNRKSYVNYIISTGVAHAPWDWCGSADLDNDYDSQISHRKSVFAFLDKKQISALQKKHCYLLLDQSHEGYHTDWLFDWFHAGCAQYEISASRVIYVTGNLAVAQQYNEWCLARNINDKMCVIPYIHFEKFIHECASNQRYLLPTSKNQIDYKTKNINDIKLYNAFQKRARPHRIWLFDSLYKHGLIDDGINSMNAFTFRNGFYDGRILDQTIYNSYKHMLPMHPRTNLKETEKHGFEGPLGNLFEQDLNHQATLDTWISVVSEASFAENTCFISEKTFKPIATRHPFIMYGNKHSLRYLRELGYKTFHGFIDESYDDLESWDRLDAIIQILKDIKAMPNEKKIQWFISMKDILDHNFEVLNNNSTVNIPKAIVTLRDYVSGVTHA
jgi:hypothetical protein